MSPGELFRLFASELSRGRQDSPISLMLAGPNGAGKSTAFNTLIGQLPIAGEWEFLNADEMVRELVDAHHGQGTPLRNIPKDELEQLQKFAQRQMHEERRQRIEARERKDFAFETVFSDPDGHRLSELQKAHEAGFYTVMVAVCCDDLEVLIERVRLRELTGGHGVEESKQRMRYPRVRANLCRAAGRLTLVMLLDNGLASRNEGWGQYRPVAVISNAKLLGCATDMPDWAMEVVSSIAGDDGVVH